MRHLLSLLSLSILLLSACEHRGHDRYGADEVGVSRAAQFGTVLAARSVGVQGKNTGTGMLLGAGAGAGGGSYVGGDDGNAWATAGSAIVGAVAGHYAEKALQDRDGVEYTVRLQNGETKTIVQEKEDGVPIFRAGQPVMLQYCDAGDHASRCRDGREYQRLFAVEKLPPYVKVKRKYVKTRETGEYSGQKEERSRDADFELSPVN